MVRTEIYTFLTLITLSWLLSFFAHGPIVGFDDANITQAYAQNIVQGHGYVYNIGGDRVEGSTSVLWTLVNIVAFLTPYPVGVLHFVSLFITSGIVILSTLIAKELHDCRLTGIINIALFSFFPFFFGWGLFSLMDIPIFIFLIVSAIYLLLRNSGPVPSSILVFVTFLLPLARPEGILVTIGIFMLWKLFYSRENTGLGDGVLILLSGVASLSLITIARQMYFGFPFPNTYYAKTSTDIFGQLVQGVEYLVKTISIPQIFVLLVLVVISTNFFNINLHSRITKYTYAAALLTFGAIITYVYLGGDHFAGARFYQFIIPLFLPVVTAFVSELAHKTSNIIVSARSIITFLIVGAIFLSTNAMYFKTGGGFSHEFRIAEDGREQGKYLTNLFGKKFTLGVTAAGGTRMGYSGIVYDVLGLNWVEMAHSGRTTDTNVPKNHGGFSSEVFFENLPDIFYPKMQSCEDTIANGLVTEFVHRITHNVTDGKDFKRHYEVFCNNRITFFGLTQHKREFISAGLKVL